MHSRSVVTRPLVAAIGVTAAITSMSRWWRRRSSSRGERVSVTAFGTDRSLRVGSRSVGVISIRAVGGTASLDLRRATVHPDVEPSISVLSIAGSADITVPDTWDVQIDSSTLGGRVTHHPGPGGGDRQRVPAAVRTVMGRVSITARPVIRAAEVQTIRR